MMYHNQQQAPAMAASRSGEHTLITRKMISRRLLLICQSVGNWKTLLENSPQLGTVTKSNPNRNTAPTTSKGISGGLCWRLGISVVKYRKKLSKNPV
jgi:hypothetical protein